MFVETIASGITVAAVPEPGSLTLGGTGLLVAGALWALRRRFGEAA
jgi:MYXO-CTERM domain-containing protein